MEDGVDIGFKGAGLETDLVDWGRSSHHIIDGLARKKSSGINETQ